jgi:DNA-directed RNA polymerase
MTVLILNGGDRHNSKIYSHYNTTTWLSEFNDRFPDYEDKEIPMKVSPHPWKMPYQLTYHQNLSFSGQLSIEGKFLLYLVLISV